MERRHSDSGPGRTGDNGRFRSSPSKDQRKKNIDNSEGRRTHIPSSRWYSKIVWKALRILGTHSKAETNPKELRTQWRNSRRIGRVSTDRTKI